MAPGTSSTRPADLREAERLVREQFRIIETGELGYILRMLIARRRERQAMAGSPR